MFVVLFMEASTSLLMNVLNKTLTDSQLPVNDS